MKPIPDAAATAMPGCHALFVEWVQSSNEVLAAICQGRPDSAAVIKVNHKKLEAYLDAVRAYERAARERLRKNGRRPPFRAAD